MYITINTPRVVVICLPDRYVIFYAMVLCDHLKYLWYSVVRAVFYGYEPVYYYYSGVAY